MNIIPRQKKEEDNDYLNAPFPVVYGLLKKRKTQEDKNIVEDYDMTYVFLSP